MFYVYTIEVDGISVYVGKGKDDYGDGRGRIDQHKQAIRGAMNGIGVTRMYAALADAQLQGKVVSFTVHSKHETEIASLVAEAQMIASLLPSGRLLNASINGSVMDDSRFEHVYALPLPDDATDLGRFKEKLRRNAKMARQKGYTTLADKLDERADSIGPAPCSPERNVSFAYQHAMKVARQKGKRLLAVTLDCERRTEKTVLEHRLTLEQVRYQERVDEAVRSETDVEKLRYLERDLKANKLMHMADQVSKRIYDVKRMGCSDGVTALKRNLAIIDKLKDEPSLLSKSYQELAIMFDIGWQNMRRLIRLAGLRKPNAKSKRRESLVEQLKADPDFNKLTYDELAGKYGVCRMTIVNASADTGLQKIRPKRPAESGLRAVKAARRILAEQANAPVSAKPAPDKQDAVDATVSKLAKCHQRLKREETLAEDLARLTPILGDLAQLAARDFELAQEACGPEHRAFIARYEWLGTPGAGIKWCFTARYRGELGGVVLLSEPYNPDPKTALIARGACASWTPKNLGSRLVMHACRELAKTTQKRQFVAYADSEANEIGQIYQACNFRFLGWKTSAYGVNEDGERKSFQTLKRTSHVVPWLKAQGIELPDTCFTSKGYLRWSTIPDDIKRLARKHIAEIRASYRVVTVQRGKYLLLQGAGPAETRALNRAYRGPDRKYPKREELEAETST